MRLHNTTMTMASVTITLIDTPDGRVATHSSFKPHAGKGCSPAQQTALDILVRTRKDWGIEPQTWAKPGQPVETPESLCVALLSPDDLGHAVPSEVRARARQALGLHPIDHLKVGA